ncbi:Ankyrin repeat, SAM and basic leucine zipper domain-containing protein 1 [Atta colombica]|uniref:Ankyrin repeat, SAM and basic leucine zipper domain-containing protein 1 n=1 Tax=Atta colombica TaxID=520822 RepID=A0A195B091_9HYME|nr:PREDICTED: ankyrin repeat, SAM and basic leucine zipper domain-containing protein 1-like [Atta colombica]XP_018054783.1 PREDICTED: ankyrin repeat, SAM and basic leucine zipper domain-containing protein 1-like [Atta colombica]KYM77876.1 Ankyrin repeat, SAM and basic leucine zipper domain-containing protein 1 [Atta colombica]
MSKYPCLRPAGMSDEEDDEDDDVFYSLEKKESTVKKHNYTSWKGETKTNSEVNNEERIYEERLVKACMMGQLKVIQEYLEQEHDVNKFLYTGWTLLLYAISSVETEIVEHLLIHGANPNKHKDGFTPLMALCNSTKGTSENSMKCLELLIRAKADANITNKHKETALMYACMSKDAEFVFELIKYVQNIDACDSDGKSALMYAASANKPDNVKILLAHNATTSLTDLYNLSAKDIADTKGFSVISALLNEDEEEIQTFYEISEIATWKDLFPNLYPRKKELVDYDVSVMLYGMGLEKYGNLFQGMDIKTFLQLTEDDLCRLGVDITIHRDQFLESLEKFHSRRWLLNSFGKLKKTDSYTIYDGVISLTNAKKQIGVIASSFQYIKNNLLKAANENVILSSEKRIEYEEELRKTQKTLKRLKNEIIQIKKLAQQVDKETNIGAPAIWIGPKSIKSNWTITISITLMVGLYLFKKMYVQRLWNICNIRISSILHFRTNLPYFFE